MAALILLVRHAQAEHPGDGKDCARALTRKGRRDFRQHAQELTRLANLEKIATSPYVRAVQTAEILAQAFRVTDVVIRPELIPGGSPSELCELMATAKPGWALVGHNPSLAASAAMALGLEVFPTKFRKGGVLGLEHKGAAFLFRWFAAPGRRIKSTL